MSQHKGSAITHFTAASGMIRRLAALTTTAVDEARRRHDTYPTASAAMGRTMTATVMLGASLKGSEKVMIEVLGNGPLGRIIAEINAEGKVRGYVQNPHVHLPLSA